MPAMTESERLKYGRLQIDQYKRERSPSTDDRKIRSATGLLVLIPRGDVIETHARQIVLDSLATDRNLDKLIELGPGDVETLRRLKQALAGISRRVS